jgi:hypothetical protein
MSTGGESAASKIINPNREVSPADLMGVEPVQVMLVLHKRVVDMESRMNYFRDVLSNFEIQLEQNKDMAVSAKQVVEELRQAINNDDEE